MIRDALAALPPVDGLRALGVGLALLDAATSGRSYAAERLPDGTLRCCYDHGSGDWLQLFFPPGGGALVVGFDHESKLSPFRKGTIAPGVYDGLPAALRPWVETPHDPAEDTFPGGPGETTTESTFAAWWDGGWRCGSATKQEGLDGGDGADWLLGCFSLDHWLERRVERQDGPVVQALLRGEPLTDEQLLTLGPEAGVARLRALQARLAR